MKYLAKLFLLIMIFTVTLSAVTQRKFLSPEEAFKIDAIRSGDVIAVSIELAKDMYIYDDKLKFEIIEPTQASLTKDINKPEPFMYKEHLIHDKSLNLLIPISLIKKYVQSGEFTLKVYYQGCSYAGICYQPLSKDFSFDLGGVDIQAQNIIAATSLSEGEQIAKSFSTSSMWLVLLTFFGFGILLSLTPCIFPMIPILSSIIVSQSGENMNPKRAFTLSLVYVLAMSAAYTIAGVIAGLFGANIQTALQNPWVIGTFSAIFVALAFSMFGFFELQMPRFIQSKLTKKSGEMQGNGLLGVAVMGFLSALIVGPCIAAPLAGALVYIGQSGDALLGGSALFVMSLGMGIPLILIGMGAGKFMPRPGGWMDSVKAVFGVVMLAVAIWMLSRVVSADIIILLWMALTIGSAVYLGALESLKENSSGWKKLIKSFAVILFIYGIMLFIGAMSQSTNPLNPLAKFSSTTTSSTQEAFPEKTPFIRVGTLKELNTKLAEATKPVMLDFYADWCVTCIELEHYTFSDPSVRKKFKEFTILQVDVTKNSDADKELLKEFGLFGPPAIMFFKDAKEVKSLRVIGFIDAEDFLKHLDKVQ